MPRSSLWLFALTSVWLLAATDARADLVRWSYQWEPHPQVIHSDPVPVSLTPFLARGWIVLSDDNRTHRTAGATDLTAANLRAYSLAPAAHPARFTNAKYELDLKLTDLASHKSGVLKFAGELNGTLSSTTAHLRNTFLGNRTESVLLGSQEYTVTIGPFTPPGPPGSKNLGALGAHVEVRQVFAPPGKVKGLAGRNCGPGSSGGQGAPDAQGAPEPSGVVLAGLGMGLAGWFGWRSKKRP